MIRRFFSAPTFASMLLAVIVSVVFWQHNACAASDDKPNVILVMCDDLGWGDVGFNGSKICKTPHLDEMAASSLRFTRFYAAAPVCSPTRGSAITGRHPYRYGIPFANRGHMKKQEITLAEALKTQGYTTGHFGKWHLGTLTTKIKDANRGRPGKTEDFSPPWLNGFDVCFSTESKVPTWNPLSVPKQFGPGESRHYGWIPVEDPAKTKHYGTHYWSGPEAAVNDNVEGDNSRIIMDRVVPFIETAAKAKKPFLAVVWFHTPHLPVVAGKKYRDMYSERSKQEQLYYGCITSMDEQVGRLRKSLRTLGIADNTIVCFASDNGPENATPGSAGHLRGRKRSLYEGGVRVPGLVEWPAKIRDPRSTDVPAVTSDYFPTILDVLGFQMNGQPKPIDGVSLLPLIEGMMIERPRPIGFQSDNQASLIDNRFKLVRIGMNTRPKGGKNKHPADKSKVMLFDIIADPAESRDIANAHPHVLKTMAARLNAWQQSCNRSLGGSDYSR
jgi:arylsulfatase A-like enzyme